MLKRKLLVSALTLIMCLGMAMPAWAAKDETQNAFAELDQKYDAAFFNQLRLDVIEDELQSAGIEIDSHILKANLDEENSLKDFVANDIELYVQNSLLLDDNEKKELNNKISALSEIIVVYIDKDTLRVYNSQDGFAGYATRLPAIEEAENNNSAITPFSQSNPTPTEIFGGDSGAFERRQLGNEGFDKITSNITLPIISNTKSDEQAWVYYGFDSLNVNGIEGGFGYWPEKEINGKTEKDVWLAYISDKPNYRYEVPLVVYKPGQTISDVNFVLKKQNSTDTYYSAYLLIGSDILICRETDFKLSDMKTMSVKRMTTIGRSGAKFNGNNIYTVSKNQKFDKVQVRKYNATSYKTWDTYDEYKEWKNNKWYGTIDCTSAYVHRNGSYVSIYK
ncbi:MAG TPA: hypothetical protein IAB00_00230 [Candidatus Avidehalobacter gallistercoris]|uniref:Uncharacterized protein n=1 Tax=Candidatus Avidehalobacter gallistercoris TaxID=2840694 RepID=A0A9D1HID9_9FIRM|nr:hypothetical protein [Candidatus Avidehalobacter gallistercoris]